ncbi:hypothetical protein NEUTE2DRAFT_125664 [Neurospora tetrasperma FGSC 2509]|nr:hypothetical protein NEUTE2DRAFT_125664 [Neurospora tetrasperma FGSC 2509]
MESKTGRDESGNHKQVLSKMVKTEWPAEECRSQPYEKRDGCRLVWGGKGIRKSDVPGTRGSDAHRPPRDTLCFIAPPYGEGTQMRGFDLLSPLFFTKHCILKADKASIRVE